MAASTRNLSMRLDRVGLNSKEKEQIQRQVDIIEYQCTPITDCLSASDVEPITVAKTHIMQMAAQHTSCAGCVAAVKSLLAQPLSNSRMLSAIMEDDGSNLILKETYQNDERRLMLLLEAFPLNTVLKKVQTPGSSQRCPAHRRSACSTPSKNNHSSSGNSNGGSGNNFSSPAIDGWDWTDAWERLLPEERQKVAVIDAAGLESALHVATSNHRFCADCKHNVLIAFDLLTQRYDASTIDNADEYNPELFRPFVGKMRPMDPSLETSGYSGPMAGRAGRQMLVCDVEDVDELICWHEDFDSQQEYASSGQRHAATLEHGQRELRSIVGSMLLSQLRVCWNARNARVQTEQFIFGLAVDAIRSILRATEDDLFEDELFEGEDRRSRKAKRKKERKAKSRAKKEELSSVDSIQSNRKEQPVDTESESSLRKDKNDSKECHSKSDESTCRCGIHMLTTENSHWPNTVLTDLCGGKGMSLIEQLEDSECGEDWLDEELLLEMETLKKGLDVCHRANLRATLQQNFCAFLSSQKGGE